jgi:hypothetical protein
MGKSLLRWMRRSAKHGTNPWTVRPVWDHVTVDAARATKHAA